MSSDFYSTWPGDFSVSWNQASAFSSLSAPTRSLRCCITSAAGARARTPLCARCVVNYLLQVVCGSTQNGLSTSPANFFHRSTNVRTNYQKGAGPTGATQAVLATDCLNELRIVLGGTLCNSTCK
jgi:hypothetical protein